MIELKNIAKTYRMGDIEVKAVCDVSLAIGAGEFVAFMGASGSGKSTLMHLLGLLDRPDGGEYFLAGQPVHTLSDDQMALVRNRLIGFVFQQFHLLPRMTAVENAALPLIYAGQGGHYEKARQKLSSVGLADRMAHNPNELSGGQQQRVAIARALVNDPLIIFADEPTGNLDTKSKDEIMGILRDLHRQGKTIIMVTHEPEMAQYAQRIIKMRDGVVISDERTGVTVDVSAKKHAIVLPDISKLSSAAYEKAKMLDSSRQAISAMVSHKMRSFLSILGILIGVGAVIAMLALGHGAKVAIEQQLSSLGSNLLMIRPGSSRVQGIALQSGMVTRMTLQDVSAIGQLDNISRVSGSVTGRVQIVYGNKNWNSQLEGADVLYAPMRASVPDVGRFFTEEEWKKRDKVVVLGTTVARELFGENNPVGETVKLNLINFRVIGVLPHKGANSFRDQDDTVIVPLPTAMYRVLGEQFVTMIYAEAVSPEVIDGVQEEIRELLIKRHRLRGEEAKDSFQIRNMSDIKAALTTTTKTMSMLLGAIAAISLLVGGIGIMNIMLVSVTERTREIGLRKAIGATRKDIMAQFLVEAVLMSLIGGIAGILLGAGVAFLIRILAGWATEVSVISVVLATAFSFVVGVVFGLWPAHKASRLDPIAALRYE